MKRLLLLSLTALAGCHGSAGPGAYKAAEALVRRQINIPTMGFTGEQFVGDAKSGATCGYFTRPNAIGGTDAVRFIVFADGNGGENPYIDDPSAAFPTDKGDFEGAWQTDCVKPGYKDPHAPADDAASEVKPRKHKK